MDLCQQGDVREPLWSFHLGPENRCPQRLEGWRERPPRCRGGGLTGRPAQFSSQLCHALMCVVSPFVLHGQFLEAGSAQGGESPIAFPGMRVYLSNSGVKNQGAGGSDRISKSASPKTLWFWIPFA